MHYVNLQKYTKKPKKQRLNSKILEVMWNHVIQKKKHQMQKKTKNKNPNTNNYIYFQYNRSNLKMCGVIFMFFACWMWMIIILFINIKRIESNQIKSGRFSRQMMRSSVFWIVSTYSVKCVRGKMRATAQHIG